MYEHNALGYWLGLALCLTKVSSSRARCPATALISEPTRYREGQTSNMLDLLIVDKSETVNKVTYSSNMGFAIYAQLSCDSKSPAQTYSAFLTEKTRPIDLPCKDMSRPVGKPTICIGENKGADQFAVTAKLISAFVFATRIVQSLYFLNTKFMLLAVTV